jgi:hypothetical protein
LPHGSGKQRTRKYDDSRIIRRIAAVWQVYAAPICRQTLPDLLNRIPMPARSQSMLAGMHPPASVKFREKQGEKIN